jgi:hypothetical protein
VSVEQDLLELARAAAELVREGTTAPPLAVNETPAVLTARDALTGSVGAALSAVIRRSAPVAAIPTTAQEVVTGPAHVLAEALERRPRVGGGDLALSDALEVPCSTWGQRWQATARAATVLEGDQEHLANLGWDRAWHAVHDLGLIASAMAYSDADLARALPQGYDTEQAQLRDHASLGMVRLAGSEVTLQTADLPPASVVRELLPPRTNRPAASAMPIRSAADLADGTTRLGGLLAHRGPAVSAAELRAVARVLADGFAVAARVLSRTDDRALVAVGSELMLGSNRLERVVAAQFGTLTRHDPLIPLMAGELRNRLVLVDAVAARLPRGASDQRLSRIVTVLNDWVRAAGPVTGTLSAVLEDLTKRRALLEPHDLDRPRPGQPLWVTAYRDSPALLAARAAEHIVTHAAPPLQHEETVVTAAQHAARAAGAGRDALRAALSTRRPEETATPGRRLADPSHRPPCAHRR